MAYYERETFVPEGCDSRIWSADCFGSMDAAGGTKYLCDACGKIAFLDHEVRHEIFPHVSGDVDSLY